jgi:hypothetical protein
MFLALFVKIAVDPSTPPFFKRSRNDAIFSAPAAIFSVRANGEFLKRERARKQAPLCLKIQQIQKPGYLRSVAAPLCYSSCYSLCYTADSRYPCTFPEPLGNHAEGK